MNKDEWHKLRSVEDSHWWFVSLRRFLFRTLMGLDLPNGSKVLDVGCGTGALLSEFKKRGYVADGFDVSREAVACAEERGLGNIQVGNANEFPVADQSYALITCVDIIECESVHPEMLVREISRVLAPNGYALVLAAAYQWLLSEHDRAVHSVRRYSRGRLRSLFADTDLKVVYSSYFFCALFPLLATWKLLNRPKDEHDFIGAESDVSLPPAVLNRMLKGFCSAESLLIPAVSLPFGTSCCVLVKKDG